MCVRRDWIEKSDPDEKQKSHTRLFLSSLHPGEHSTKLHLAKIARSHWSVENKNHFKRDCSLWAEDDHRHRRPNAALNLALTRNALLAIIPFDEKKPLPHFFQHYHHHPGQAISLICKKSPQT